MADPNTCLIILLTIHLTFQTKSFPAFRSTKMIQIYSITSCTVQCTRLPRFISMNFYNNIQ